MTQNSRELTDRRLRALLAALDEREHELRGLVAERRSALDDQGLAAEPAGDEADRAFGRVRSAIESDLLDLLWRAATGGLAGVSGSRWRRACRAAAPRECAP